MLAQYEKQANTKESLLNNTDLLPKQARDINDTILTNRFSFISGERTVRKIRRGGRKKSSKHIFNVVLDLI